MVQVIERRPSVPAAAKALPAGPGAELRQPLLAEEAPPTPPTQAAGLSKAIAIIRYIEAITGERRGIVLAMAV